MQKIKFENETLQILKILKQKYYKFKVLIVTKNMRVLSCFFIKLLFLKFILSTEIRMIFLEVQSCVFWWLSTILKQRALYPRQLGGHIFQKTNDFSLFCKKFVLFFSHKNTENCKIDQSNQRSGTLAEWKRFLGQKCEKNTKNTWFL